MAKIQSSPNYSLSQAQGDINRQVQQFLKDTQEVVNGRIEISQNMSGELTSVFFPVANSDVRVAHSLGRAPTGYIITGLTAALIVYNGAKARDSQAIYLRASAVGRANLFIF